MNTPKTQSAQTAQATAPLTPALPIFWPLAAWSAIAKNASDLSTRNLRFLAEEDKLYGGGVKPTLATPNTPLLDLRTMIFRDYSVHHHAAHGSHKTHPAAKAATKTTDAATGAASSVPTIVDAPYAGHSAVIADYHQGQSLMETLRAGGLERLYLTDWKSATEDMKDLEIDQYLAELNVCVDEVGGRANLVGLCQGGWLATMFAARFPHKVASLVLAGTPIDTDAGDGPIKKMAHKIPTETYAELVAMGQGLMRGRFMLSGWKNMHPEQHYFSEHVDLYEHMDDPDYLHKEEVFASWYENPIDLPGRWYMQAIVQLFKENRLAKGQFVALGRTLNLKTITCPVYLLGGESDDITTPEQVLNARQYLGTPDDQIVSRVVPGGHIGLFMGSRTLVNTWPGIAQWLAART